MVVAEAVAADKELSSSLRRQNDIMTRKLVKTGNSSALIVDKTMKEHLGVTDEVEVSYEKGRVVLKKPMTIEEAAERTVARYGKALKKLAE